MNTGMQERLRLFDENNRLFSQKYWYGWSGMNAISALFFTNEGRTTDIAKVEECRQMVKTKVGIFSNIRGNLIRPLCVRAALSQNPDAYLDGVIEAYKAIQKGKVLRSEFEVLAAIILYENCDPKNYDHIAEEIWNT